MSPQGPPVAPRLREVMAAASEPLTLDEIYERILALGPIVSKNPRNTVRNAISTERGIESLGKGRYDYLPRALTGTVFRWPIEDAGRADGILAVGAELDTALSPFLHNSGDRPDPIWELADGPTVAVSHQPGIGYPTRYRPDEAFWPWLETVQRRQCDALLLRCLDGARSRFAVSGVRTRTLDREAVAARNAAVLDAARDVGKRTARGMMMPDFTARLIVRGLYREEPPPEPLDDLLFEHDGRFILEGGWIITYRRDLTPAVRELFAQRIEDSRDDSLDLISLLRGEEPLPPPPPRPRPRPRKAKRQRPAAVECYRLRVTLDKGIWRDIEILDSQTLDDLHSAIQAAYNWANDHLYAFYMSGKPYDSLTEIMCDWNEDAEPPTTGQVRLWELKLRLRQRFLYVFDFGDDWQHDIRVLKRLSPVKGVRYPRVVAEHGDAPPQYPDWDEEDEEDDNWAPVWITLPGPE